jgi:hypothetical protein
MKNECDSTSSKKKNEDFLKELNKDRLEKNCEYAVLVSLLESDNDLFNAGIVDFSYRYPKMYVVRPQCFLPIISLLRNASLKALEYKSELATIKEQPPPLRPRPLLLPPTRLQRKLLSVSPMPLVGKMPRQRRTCHLPKPVTTAATTGMVIGSGLLITTALGPIWMPPLRLPTARVVRLLMRPSRATSSSSKTLIHNLITRTITPAIALLTTTSSPTVPPRLPSLQQPESSKVTSSPLRIL